MSRPHISILLPVRNGSRTLRRAVESCLAQTFRDFELLLVNDASTDETPELVRSFAAADPRVVPLKASGGLISALQTAHEAARAPLLARMDADDFAYPDRLSEQAAFLEKNQDVAACGTQVRILGSGHGETPREGFSRYESWINALTAPEEISRERFVESPLVHPSVMMQREAFEACGGYRDPGWAEDYDLWLRMLEKGMRLAKVERVLLDWSDGPDRLTRTDGRYSLLQFMRAKAHFLGRMSAVRSRGVIIAGAGPTGKQLAALLREENVTVHAFIEVHPRRIGKKIAGIPVWEEARVGEAGALLPVALSAVGQPGRRQTIREFFAGRGYIEGENFFCFA